mgnify:CR=1 FL=1
MIVNEALCSVGSHIHVFMDGAGDYHFRPMCMQHASVEPMHSDSLTAIHAIADFMDRVAGGTDVTEEFILSQSLFLEALLWGRMSFAAAMRVSYGDQYASLKRPPLRDVLRVFHELLSDLQCVLILTEEDIEECERSPAFACIAGDGWPHDEQGASTWEKIRRAATSAPRCVQLPLRECYSVCEAILDKRVAAFEEALSSVNDPYGPDHTGMLALLQHVPIKLDYEVSGVERVRDALLAAEREYLEAFMGDRVRWTRNTPKWAWQKGKVLPVLEERSRTFAQCWIDVTDPAFHEKPTPDHDPYELSCDCKLAETLLALSLQHTIDILEVAPVSYRRPVDDFAKTGLRFRVAFHEESADKEPLVCASQPVLTLARNERTGELSVNGQHLVSPHSGGTGDRLMEELLRRNKAERIVKLGEKEVRAIKGNLKYPLPNLLTDLGFQGDLRKAFFPSSSKSGVIFVNPIFAADLKEQGVAEVPEVGTNGHE